MYRPTPTASRTAFARVSPMEGPCAGQLRESFPGIGYATALAVEGHK
jgi:hypothetical protein